jgi:pantetheine-phosphate adenylyltransferase
LFTVPEREEMIFEATRGFGNVSVTTFNGLLVDFAREQGAKAVFRGIRAISDYEYEFQMATPLVVERLKAKVPNRR